MSEWVGRVDQLLLGRVNLRFLSNHILKRSGFCVGWCLSKERRRPPDLDKNWREQKKMRLVKTCLKEWALVCWKFKMNKQWYHCIVFGASYSSWCHLNMARPNYGQAYLCGCVIAVIALRLARLLVMLQTQVQIQLKAMIFSISTGSNRMSLMCTYLSE